MNHSIGGHDSGNSTLWLPHSERQRQAREMPDFLLAVCCDEMVREAMSNFPEWANHDDMCGFGDPCDECHPFDPPVHACGKPITTWVEILPGDDLESMGAACDDHALEMVSNVFTPTRHARIVQEMREWLAKDRRGVLVFSTRPLPGAESSEWVR